MKGLAARKQGHPVTDSGSPPGVEPGRDGKSRPQSKHIDHSVCLELVLATKVGYFAVKSAKVQLSADSS